MSCVMSAYLGLCHLVTATASVAVLDFMNLVSTARPDSNMYFMDDLAFMDAYKAARCVCVVVVVVGGGQSRA
jgi:hypothetical protein